MTSRTRSLAIVTLVSLTLGALMLGCGEDSSAPRKLTVQDYIASVQLTAIGVGETPIPYDAPVVAVYHDGAPPEESEGPTMGLDSVSGAPVQGKDLTYNFGSYAKDYVKVVYVWVAQASGYWLITLPEPQGSNVYGVGMTVKLKMANGAPLKPFDLRAKATDTLGATGVTATRRLIVSKPDSTVQPEDVVATLAWTGGSDLDLHVVDPFGHDLSFDSPNTPEGGTLAPDGNGHCDVASANHETATWTARTAPKGTYTIYVVLYQDCGDGTAAPFDVSLQQAGGAVRHFSGTFTGAASTSTPDTIVTFRVR